MVFIFYIIVFLFHFIIRPIFISIYCIKPVAHGEINKINWNKTKLPRSGLRFSRPSTVLFYFSFKDVRTREIKPTTGSNNCNKTCNAATMGQAHAHSHWRLSQWRGLSDGRSSRVTELWCPSEYSSSEKVPRDWLQLATKCIILSTYLIMHNSSATILAVLSFRF